MAIVKFQGEHGCREEALGSNPPPQTLRPLQDLGQGPSGLACQTPGSKPPAHPPARTKTELRHSGKPPPITAFELLAVAPVPAPSGWQGQHPVAALAGASQEL